MKKGLKFGAKLLPFYPFSTPSFKQFACTATTRTTKNLVPFRNQHFIFTNHRNLNAQRLRRKGGGVEACGKSRGGRIRTYGLVVPNDARYRAALHPESRPMGQPVFLFQY
jgi:hypothetical protein